MKKSLNAVIASVIVYFVAFFIMAKTVVIGAPTVALIPAVTVGWFYGLWPGVIAGVIAFPLNTLMLLACGLGIDQLLGGGGIAGTPAIIFVAAIVGRIRDLSRRINIELKQRQKAEQQIKHHSDNLDKLVRDKTEALQKANKALHEEVEQRKAIELRSRSVLETARDAIFTLSAKGEIQFFNRAAEQLLGYTEQEVVGKNFLILIPERDRAAQKKAIIQFSQNQELPINRPAEGSLLRKDGSEVRAEVSFSLWSAGQDVCFTAIVHDLTERIRDQELLKQTKELAEEANRAKSNFLAKMSHEIRTPMNGIIGFTDMLMETSLDTDQRDYTHTIRSSGEALLSLINDILDYSKVEAGKIDFEEIDFDLEVLACDVCDLIKPRIEHGVELLCRIGDNLPALVSGDPHRIKQVLVNLMGNASKFTKAGEIELFVEVEEERDGKFMIHSRIRDTGIGIPKDKLESIFNLFQQADDSTTRQYGGTGLGLSISRQVSRLMGGDVWVESVEGEGSTFHCKLWVHQTEKKTVRRLGSVALSEKKVLITDDNKNNLEILNHIMASVGMRVESFSNGLAALSAALGAEKAGDPFDICILDIMMPDISGFQLAEKIRSELGDAIPLLAFSSSMAKGGAKKCQEAGFNGFLPKPINRIKLFKMIERLLFKTEDSTLMNAEEAKLITQYSLREEAKHCISILLAEDNPVNIKLAENLLTKAGYTVDIAHNGREAVDMFSAEPEKYDIILMDVQMPELSGLDATKVLREKGFDRIPIVAMTAEAMKGDREKCLKAGMNDYIAKPIKREIVFDILRNWVIEKVSYNEQT